MIGQQIRTEIVSVRSRLHAFEARLINQPLALHGVALSRMLAGLAYVGVLLTNFPARHLLYGSGSDWVKPIRDADTLAPWVGLFEGLPGALFTLVYLIVIALGLAFVMGWHTRLVGIAFLVGCMQILELNPLVSDQGDNILRIGIIFLLLTDCSAVWSFDARRAARRGTDDAPGDGWRARWRAVVTLPPARSARIIVHNAAVIGLGFQIITIYIAAAMFKIPGVGWSQGTAIAYPLRSDSYQVWPFLNDLATNFGVVVWMITYGAIFLQLYFPVLLLNRVTRRLALVAIIGLHLGIAVMMGLPWFTLAMIAFDGIFVSTATYLALERWIVPLARRARSQTLGRWMSPA